MNHLNFLGSKRDFKRDIDYIHTLSTKIEKKLANTSLSDDAKIEKLTIDELQDINKIAGLANFILFKYEDKKETKLILEQFVSVITESINSMESLDDEISELILSAEDSIDKVKNMHSKISTKSDLGKSYLNDINSKSKTGSINLTNFTTEVNTAEYQQNSQQNIIQVI